MIEQIKEPGKKQAIAGKVLVRGTKDRGDVSEADLEKAYRLGLLSPQHDGRKGDPGKC